MIRYMKQEKSKANILHAMLIQACHIIILYESKKKRTKKKKFFRYCRFENILMLRMIYSIVQGLDFLYFKEKKTYKIMKYSKINIV
jgi:hypothetical protein